MKIALTIQKLVCQCGRKHFDGSDNIFSSHPIRVEIEHALFAALVITGRVLPRLLVSPRLLDDWHWSLTYHDC